MIDLIKLEDKFNNTEISELRRTIPNDIINKIYYTDRLATSLIYYDEKEKIMFETNVYYTSQGFQIAKPSDVDMTAAEIIKAKLIMFKKYQEDGDTEYLIECMVPFAYRKEYENL